MTTQKTYSQPSVVIAEHSFNDFCSRVTSMQNVNMLYRTQTTIDWVRLQNENIECRCWFVANKQQASTVSECNVANAGLMCDKVCNEVVVDRTLNNQVD